MLPMVLEGARTHNLRAVNLVLSPGEFVAITGPSGSGKSSLAIDTLYAEGQRRFVESFSPYARQFLERLSRPDMDKLDPVAAGVAVDRKAQVKSSRSTLATLADLEPYLAALFGSEAMPVCPDCHLEAVFTSANSVVDRLLTEASALKDHACVLTYPVSVPSTERFLDLRQGLLKDGFRRLLINGKVRDLDEVRPSEVHSPTTRVEVVLDRVKLSLGQKRRLQDAIELGWSRGDGKVMVWDQDVPRAPVKVARGLVCPNCARTFEPASPRLFSYNSALGACETCRGFGRMIAVDWNKVIPNPERSLSEGAIKAWAGKSAETERGLLRQFARKKGIPLEAPWSSLSREQQALVLDGEGSWNAGKFPGVKAWFKWLEGRTYKMHVRVFLARYREYALCEACHGARLKPLALSYKVGGLNLGEWHTLTVANASTQLGRIVCRSPSGGRVVEALQARLGYLDRVGLGYLTLNRQARTLSGGEAQRASLTTALGAALTGTLFVLDEPTVGLHAADVPALGAVMRDLSRSGNTVVVIEHDERIVRQADRVIELGPKGGQGGGTILFDGTPKALAKNLSLPTAQVWQRGARAVAPPVRTFDRGRTSEWLTIRGARANNLNHVDVSLPLRALTVLSGPSGSGKSTLAEEILYRAAARHFGKNSERPEAHDAILGLQQLSAAVLVDQSPLGRTARGNAATYSKAWEHIRKRLADEPAAKRAGLSAGHFSFNSGEGRCEACNGEGYETVEMQFLADVQLLCPTCQGRRFKPSVLAITLAGKSVAEWLQVTVEEALALLPEDGAIEKALRPLVSVGLGYLPLGQPLSTLSGGEAQRLKLARAFSEKRDGTLFVIDEPSAGLHGSDTEYVIAALQQLVADGATVVVVEHDLDILRAADWVVDLGPGAGPEGGRLVAEGTPEAVKNAATKTGQALRGEIELGKTEPVHQLTGRDAAQGRNDARHDARHDARNDAIVVAHAREHNLKDVSCRLPHGALSVITGPSGSGKSSLAFDVIFAEGQRRFMETLSPYARQFLPMLPRPNVDSVLGVPPSIALEQRTTKGGVNSTVATVTEIAHYLRLLFAKLGEPHCQKCGAAVRAIAPETLLAILRKKPKTHTLYAPAVRQRKGTYLELFAAAGRAGVKQARVDGQLIPLEPPPRLKKSVEHDVDLVVYQGALARLGADEFSRALEWGAGNLVVAEGAPSAGKSQDEVFSTARSCGECGTGMPELDPRWFSFNTKQGQCPRCEGAGFTLQPGTEVEVECRDCKGTRLARLPREVVLQGTTYPAFTALSVEAALESAEKWKFAAAAKPLSEAAHRELVRRLKFVESVGLGYLALDRAARTLSGGEMQRLRLSAQLGSGLTGALYVLDEPTIGLHPRDTYRLIDNLRALTKQGSTVMVVEHDEGVIRAADYVIDIGPQGGAGGGHIVAQGSAEQVWRDPASPTAQALQHKAGPARAPIGEPAKNWLELRSASMHHLQNVDFLVPHGRLTVVAGVSGSGKSTLVRHVFYPALRQKLGLVAEPAGAHRELVGTFGIKRAMAVDQSPIGRTPRSVPVTFLSIWDDIRKLFAEATEAKIRGYGPGRFSFNSPKSGRCASCDGQGVIISEMAFLPDVISPCEACAGARFEAATMDIKFMGAAIGDVLRMTADEAQILFANHKKIRAPLATLSDLGVGYLQLGQPSNTLSGGEAQRLKLAAELTAKSAHEPTLYVLDEPTTGLHMTDVRRLVSVLDRLVQRGDTVLVVEHNPEVIQAADWVIELGPEAGVAGGRIVFAGPPDQLLEADTATGRFLAGDSASRRARRKKSARA